MLKRQGALCRQALSVVFGLVLVMLAGGLCHTVSPAAAADSPRLELNDVSLDIQPQKVSLRSALTLIDSGFVRTQLQDGAQMCLTCTLVLEEEHTFRNTELTRITRLFMLRHDPLTREFVMSNGEDKFQLRALIPLMKQCWSETPIDLVPKTPLVQGQSYRLSLRLALEYADVPPWLEKTLFFWSWEVADPLTLTRTFCF